MKMNRPLFEPGDIVQHFKRETIKEPHDNAYLYEVIGYAKHIKTEEGLMVYKSISSGTLYAEPAKMFYSEVDRRKNIERTQKYRFEKYHGVLYADGL